MNPLSTETESKLRQVFRDIIHGKAVKRTRHELLWEGQDVTELFLQELHREGFAPTTVAAIDVEPGHRVPAFYVENTVAYFGWVFWEKFWENRMRKLWGSVVRNARGDWKIQISPQKERTIYANASVRYEMDLDRPSDF